jgi:hypothetical protein
MVRVPKMACGNISLACGIHYCPTFCFFLCPTSVTIWWRICVSDCVETAYELPLLPNQTLSKIFLQKLEEVQSVEWIFIAGAPAWWWMGENVTLDKTFCSLPLKHEVAAALTYIHIFFLIAFLQEAFILNIIITLCINYINIICINNNAVFNTLWKIPRPYVALQTCHWHMKVTVWIWACALKRFRQSWSTTSVNTIETQNCY